MGAQLNYVDTPTKEDLMSISGVNQSTLGTGYMLYGYDWLTTTSFWTKTTNGKTLWRAAGAGSYLDLNYSDERSYNCYQYYGVRPIISVSLTNFESSSNWKLSKDNNLNGKTDAGDLICYKSECFNVRNGTYVAKITDNVGNTQTCSATITKIR